MAHIFGIPHSLGEIVDWAGTQLFGGTGVTLPGAATPPIFQAGVGSDIGPLSSALDFFGGAWDAAKEINVANGNGQFLGCPIEESDGCEPHKKRYTITIDNATGQCIKIKRQKSRKRRRRLASLSDIKDIAALKQVLGGGKALDTWIATRGR
jgi:hypothetical protein